MANRVLERALSKVARCQNNPRLSATSGLRGHRAGLVEDWIGKGRSYGSSWGKSKLHHTEIGYKMLGLN